MSDSNTIPKSLIDAIGTESEQLSNDIEKGAIRRFAEAIEDNNPSYLNEEYAKSLGYRNVIAPPTFLRYCINSLSLDFNEH